MLRRVVAPARRESAVRRRRRAHRSHLPATDDYSSPSGDATLADTSVYATTEEDNMRAGSLNVFTDYFELHVVSR
ncbi:unnamed protein product [Urochloa humidicola]